MEITAVVVIIGFAFYFFNKGKLNTYINAVRPNLENFEQDGLELFVDFNFMQLKTIKDYSDEESYGQYIHYSTYDLNIERGKVVTYLVGRYEDSSYPGEHIRCEAVIDNQRGSPTIDLLNPVSNKKDFDKVAWFNNRKDSLEKYTKQLQSEINGQELAGEPGIVLSELYKKYITISTSTDQSVKDKAFEAIEKLDKIKSQRDAFWNFNFKKNRVA